MYYQGENNEVTWGLLGGSVIENYFEDAEEEKFRSSTNVHIHPADGHQVVKLWVIANNALCSKGCHLKKKKSYHEMFNFEN